MSEDTLGIVALVLFFFILLWAFNFIYEKFKDWF